MCIEKKPKEKEKMPEKDRPPRRTRDYLRDVERGKENEIG